MASIEKTSFVNYVNSNFKDKPAVLLMFTASWCAPCKKIKRLLTPILDDVRKKATVLFIDVDTHKDQNGTSADFFKFLKSKRIVRGVPSLLLYIKSDNEHDLYPDFFCESDENHFKALVDVISNI